MLNINRSLEIFRFIPSTYRARSVITSLIHEAYHTINMGGRKPSHTYIPAITPPGVTNAKKINNEGLIVYIHGLNGNTNIGEKLYQKEIEKQAAGKYEIWVPQIPKKGNCSLEEAATPLLEAVRKYIQTNPGKPVQLIGHSNGGRIAAYIDTHTRDMDVNMRITGISGVFLGSDIVTLGNYLKLTKNFVPSIFIKEVKTNSPLVRKLISDMREEVKVGSRDYTFYTTIDDLAIPNYTSCLPKISQNEEHIIKSGCSHSSIQNLVYKEEVKKVIKFMEKNSEFLDLAI